LGDGRGGKRQRLKVPHEKKKTVIRVFIGGAASSEESSVSLIKQKPVKGEGKGVARTIGPSRTRATEEGRKRLEKTVRTKGAPSTEGRKSPPQSGAREKSIVEGYLASLLWGKKKRGGKTL